MIHITPEALDSATTEQIKSVAYLHNERVEDVTVMKGGLGLSDRFLSFRQDWKSGGPIYGGIDTDGSVST